jgi:hypothetical protein
VISRVQIFVDVSDCILRNQVIPITTINIQKVYGDTNTVQHARTTNNTISMRAATSRVIEKMLPRSLSDIGMIHFRSRAKKLAHANISNRYETIAVDTGPVIKALAVLTGTADGMIAPLNGFYIRRDTSDQQVTKFIEEVAASGGHMPFFDMTEDDNDDELGNIEQQMKRKIATYFGGAKYIVQQPITYNSRFNAHMYVYGSGAIHAISAACHWDFGGMNTVHTCRQFIALCQEVNVRDVTSTMILDCIGFALNEANPNVDMEARSNFPPVMRISFACPNRGRSSLNALLEECLVTPSSAIVCPIPLQHVDEIKQIIIQTAADKFITLVRATMGSQFWYEFDATSNDFANMITPISCSDVDVSLALHCCV